ncbi:MAG TPA: potassium-transporting ATPase subunit KdpC [Chitinophagaceae bacterium]|nr:potassium-transporting ATPase subunit KdpC [Chitinophagaceae bacterium]
MKKYLSPSVRLTLAMLIFCVVIYFTMVSVVGNLVPGRGNGVPVVVNGRTVGYELIGQRFTADKYFSSRPSAVEYNASGSAGSNFGPSNPVYMKIVQARIDSFMVHNPGIDREQIPAELVTASGSGLDPHISPASAYIQISRVAKQRGVSEARLKALVDQHIQTNPVGPDVVNVLKLNIALDSLE